MDAAAKLARQKVKATQQATKPDPATKKEETAAPTPAPAEATPSLFGAQPQTAEPVGQAAGEEGGKATS